MFERLSHAPSTVHTRLEELRSDWADWIHIRDALGPNPLHVRVTNAYIKCLIAHGYREAATQLVESLPRNAMDSVTAVQLLQGFNRDQSRPNGSVREDASQQDGPRAHRKDGQATSAQDPSRALAAWERALGNEAGINPAAIASLATLLTQTEGGVPQYMVMDLLHKHFGIDVRLKRKPLTRDMVFDSRSLTSLLRLLLRMDKRMTAANVFAQVTDEPDRFLERDALDFVHCGLGMVAEGERGKPEEVEGEFRPAPNHSDVLTDCLTRYPYNDARFQEPQARTAPRHV